MAAIVPASSEAWQLTTDRQVSPSRVFPAGTVVEVMYVRATGQVTVQTRTETGLVSFTVEAEEITPCLFQPPRQRRTPPERRWLRAIP